MAGIRTGHLIPVVWSSRFCTYNKDRQPLHERTQRPQRYRGRNGRKCSSNATPVAISGTCASKRIYPVGEAILPPFDRSGRKTRDVLFPRQAAEGEELSHKEDSMGLKTLLASTSMALLALVGAAQAETTLTIAEHEIQPPSPPMRGRGSKPWRQTQRQPGRGLRNGRCSIPRESRADAAFAGRHRPFFNGPGRFRERPDGGIDQNRARSSSSAERPSP